MKGHVSDVQIRSYRAQALATAELVEVSDHLASCEACRVRMASPVELRAQVSAIQSLLEAKTASGHLPYDEIAAYVDGQMASDAAARVELHARECQSCASTLEELRILRAELQAEPARRWRWHRPTWSTWFSGRPVWQGGLALACGVAGLVMIVVLARSMPRQGHTLQAERGPTKIDGSPSASRANAGNTVRDGSRFVTIGEGGTVAGLEALPTPYRTMLERALVTRQVPLPGWMPELNQERGVLLGAPGTQEAIRLLSPVGTAVEEQQPVFRWTTSPDAEYQVSVYDSGYNLVGGSNWSSGGEWRPAQALGQGTRYSWQIHMRRGGEEITIPAPPAPEARFRVLGEDERAEVARARGRWGDSHLIMGVVYASAGLLDEADRELGLASSQNPDSQPLAALRASVGPPRANHGKQ
jgi:anti-sigma factor RsiW